METVWGAREPMLLTLAGVGDFFEIIKTRPLFDKRFSQIERESNLGWRRLIAPPETAN